MIYYLMRKNETVMLLDISESDSSLALKNLKTMLFYDIQAICATKTL